MSRTMSNPSGPRLKAVSALRPTGRKAGLPRPRVSAIEREALILAEAVRFFAEVGFAGDTRELARRAHVTHPLLYKYFATKEALIERVYEAVYLGRWNPEWEKLIADRSMPVRERMTHFYIAFASVILEWEWVRLFMFFGLRGADINQRWFAVVKERLVLPFCAELRHEFNLPSIDTAEPTIAELELVQGISTRIFAFGIRQHVYGMPLPGDGDVTGLIKTEIDTFFDGIGPTLEKLVAASRRLAPRKRPRAKREVLRPKKSRSSSPRKKVFK